MPNSPDVVSQCPVGVFKVTRYFTFHFVEHHSRGEKCDMECRASLDYGSSQYAEPSQMA